MSNNMEKIISLAKRRGFIFPTAEIYGGLGGFWDWGPLGVELKNNIKKAWWRRFVQERNDMVGLDAAIITNPKVWEKSGHLLEFKDLEIDCRSCQERFKVEDLISSKLMDKIKESAKKIELELASKRIYELKPFERERKFRELYSSALPEINRDVVCPSCSSKNWTPPQNFNTMFKTFVGPVEDSVATAYLRPETAQNIFVNFENIKNAMRLKIPFGIAQVGKAFRNEITPGNFIFRSREFEQMEIEFFVDPKDDKKWFDYWVAESEKWFLDLGIKKENLKKRVQKKEELAHYAKATTDLEYNWPFSGQGGKGWQELIGIANRTDFDLKAHGFKYKDEKEEFVPYVIEPSFGVERPALAFLLDSFKEIKGGRTTTTDKTKEEEVVLRLHKDLAPIKAGILPLARKPELVKVAKAIFDDLKKHLMVQYDETGSIGRRYRRQDEIGTPYCLTIDFDSLEDKKVTVRDRDTMKQERVEINDLVNYLKEKYD